MLPKSNRTYIEITNPIHGGTGWEFGHCLWSPVRDRGSSRAWLLMENVRSDDTILHLLKHEDGYHWEGVSLASSGLYTVENEPPEPANWKDMAPYQRINVREFNEIPNPPHINDFFSLFAEQLRALLRTPERSFYQEYGESKRLMVAQRYFAEVPDNLYELFSQYSTILGFNPSFDTDQQEATSNEPAYPDESKPGRIPTTISRIVRDTKLVKDLKRQYKWKCQICGERLALRDGKHYAEGHHLLPLGVPYNGPDVAQNVIVLCPNHHAEFDYGSIAIEPNTLVIIHTDEQNVFNGKTLAYDRPDLRNEYLRFHFEKLYWGNK